MKKSVVLILFFGFLMKYFVLSSVNSVAKPIIVQPQKDTLVDSTLYNSYLVHYKRGAVQNLQYPSDWSVYEMIGPMWSRKVVKIDTIQKNVFYNELN